MTDLDLEPFTIGNLARLIHAKEISPVELIRSTIENIHLLQPKINAFITILQDQALQRAREAEKEIQKGGYRGPLHGIPYAAKDNMFTAGMLTTVGSKVLERYRPNYNATVVNRLEKAGAILIGKTNMHEFAYGVTNLNEHYGPTQNPWKTEHMTGGSSGGSAGAVIASCVPLALGTDTGGSVRIPSALCGTIGLKPTFGRVSKYGVWPLSETMDHVGIITRTVQDIALALKCIAGFDGHDPLSIDQPVPDYSSLPDTDIKGMRIGIPDSFFFEMVDPEIKIHLEKAIESINDLGGEIVQVTIPNPLEAYNASGTILHSEAAASLGRFYDNEKELLGQDVRGMIETFGRQSKLTVEQAEIVRQKTRKEWGELFREVDLLVTPGVGITAPPIDNHMVKIQDMEFHVGEILTRCFIIFNLLGIPALVMPIGISKKGLPISIQLVGRPSEEETILHLAHRYESRVFSIKKGAPSLE